MYSYSKTRGLFAGVSLEGSVICTRNDANEKMYGERYTAKQLLNGTVPPPLEADSLYRALNAKFRSFGNTGKMYQRTIEREPTKIYRNTTISAPGTLRIPPIRQNIGYNTPRLIEAPPQPNRVSPISTNYDYTPMSPSAPYPTDSPIQYNKPFEPDSQIPPHINKPFQPDSPTPQYVNKPNQFTPVMKHSSVVSLEDNSSEKISIDSISMKGLPTPPLSENQYSEIKKTVPPLFEGQRMSFTTTVPAPLFEGQRMSFIRDLNPTLVNDPSIHQKAKALYAYTGEQEGDLSFEQGDVILVTEKIDAWWKGKLRGQSGSVRCFVCICVFIFSY